jgi:hypothetical protein
MAMTENRRRLMFLPAALLAALGLLGGCGLPEALVYPFAPREAVKDVKAEYDLTAQRLLILPYLGTDAQFEFQGADLVITDRLVREIREHLRGRVHHVVNPAEVLRYQQTNLEWANTPVQQIGKEFNVDKVLYVEISRLTLLEDNSVNLYRGRIAARIQVVDVDSAALSPVVYQTDVLAEIPEKDDPPVSADEGSRNAVERATAIRFAENVIKKFYDHQEKVIGKP